MEKETHFEGDLLSTKAKHLKEIGFAQLYAAYSWKTNCEVFW